MRHTPSQSERSEIHDVGERNSQVFPHLSGRIRLPAERQDFDDQPKKVPDLISLSEAAPGSHRFNFNIGPVPENEGF